MKRLVDANAAESSKEAIAGTLKSKIIQLLSIPQKVQQNQLFLLSVSFSLSVFTSFSLFEAVKFHPSGRLLMATGGDRSLRFFQIDGEKNEKILSTMF